MNWNQPTHLTPERVEAGFFFVVIVLVAFIGTAGLFQYLDPPRQAVPLMGSERLAQLSRDWRPPQPE